MSRAHAAAKLELVDWLNREHGAGFDPEVFTIGFARRATGYKRADLLFADVERLKAIARDSGRLQVVFAGKAHPRDWSGKEAIKRIFTARRRLAREIPIVYVENYDSRSPSAWSPASTSG